ncbi:DUF3293 domain-containing protein [Cyanobium sp. Morenito 9A2]|uniref:DUF3293 domain-containing protein n=1 Tax=Cyanobium sp. Morenito 9A2 TaxID=2823718 RepID=UPI0020CC1AE9|nr:DUF3293 domain-containing protein [Cyanobium sp. Morenito 9A2]MCP9850835.1 DUF3293 domain-containing protein [Cyanobium sp. Morenito 9A2]
MFKDYAGIEVLAMEAIRAEHFATSDLLLAKPDDIAGEVLAWMTGNDFDVAPVTDHAALGFLQREDLRAMERQSSIQTAIRPLDEALIVAPSLSLQDAIRILTEKGWFFLQEDGDLVGIATRDDLSKPAVCLYLFAKTMALEAGLRRLIGTYDTTPIPDSPPDENDDSPGPRYLREVILRTKQNKKLLGDLGYSGKGASGRFDELSKFVNRLRNHIAHGRSLLAISEKVASYGSRLQELDLLLGRIQSLSVDSLQAWEAYASTEIVRRVVSEEVWAGSQPGDLPEGSPWIILTASNPHEEVLSEAENAERNHELVNLLAQRGYDPIPVEGRSSCGRRREESVAIRGMQRDEAGEVCKLFRQRGFFEITDLNFVVYSADGVEMRRRGRAT